MVLLFLYLYLKNAVNLRKANDFQAASLEIYLFISLWISSYGTPDNTFSSNV